MNGYKTGIQHEHMMWLGINMRKEKHILLDFVVSLSVFEFGLAKEKVAFY